MRAERAALARLYAPHLTREDFAVLTDAEYRIGGAALSSPMMTPFPEESGEHFAGRRVYSENMASQYRYRDVPIAADEALSPPVISVERTGAYPVVSIPEIADPDGEDALYYFEFDTSPEFDSPNFWRYPALLPYADRDDLTGRQGLPFFVLRTTHRGVDGHSIRIEFPFRASAMRLPNDWSQLDFNEMQRHARGLAYGLQGRDAVDEVFAYARQIYFWASDTVHRSPLDTFTAGLGECGHVNDLAGALLEMNGYRYRNISGFNPQARVTYPGGGHSAVEVFDGEAWSYLDSYLDVLTDGVPAARLGDSKYADLPIYALPESYHDGPLGTMLTLENLFAYRTYYDKLNRLPAASMLLLEGNEEVYGLQWPLNVAPEWSPRELFADELTIHVRARYIFAGGESLAHVSEPAPAPSQIRVSPWGHTSFTVRGRPTRDDS